MLPLSIFLCSVAGVIMGIFTVDLGHSIYRYNKWHKSMMKSVTHQEQEYDDVVPSIGYYG